MFFHAFRYLPYISLSQHEMIFLSTGYSWETDNRDAPGTCKSRHHFSFTRPQLGWSTFASHMEVLQVTWGASAPMYIFLGPMDYWKSILLKQMAKAQEGKPYCSNTFPAFACVGSANISVARAGHVA